MSEQTNIEWCDSTFNPWIGCTKVSPACDHCYAERLDGRGIFGGAHWGPGVPRKRTSAANWRKPVQWNKTAHRFVQCYDCGWRGEQHGGPFHCHACGSLSLKVVRRRVFCASLADMLDNASELEWFVDALDLWRFCSNIDWLVLTKRIGNLRTRLREALVFAKATGRAELADWIARWLNGIPPENVWIGATICNQQEADRDIPKLIAVPAVVRFLSIEPMLGLIDLTPAFLPCRNAEDTIMDPTTGAHECCSECDYTGIGNEMGIDWIIAGGESGPQARLSHPEWFRCLRDDCKDAGVPFLFKQWGEWKPISQMDEPEHAALYVSRVKAKSHESQDNLDDICGRACTVQTAAIHLDGSTHGITEPMAFLQGTEAMQAFKVGKKAAGRRLDGVTHTGFPEPRA